LQCCKLGFYGYCLATQSWRLKFAKIASKFPGLTFAVADEEENNDLLKEFGFDESSEEINVGILDSKERKYAMKPQEEFDSDEVVSFLKKFQKGIYSRSILTVLLLLSAIHYKMNFIISVYCETGIGGFTSVCDWRSLR
jgi:hypothetical protein